MKMTTQEKRQAVRQAIQQTADDIQAQLRDMPSSHPSRKSLVAQLQIADKSSLRQFANYQTSMGTLMYRPSRLHLITRTQFDVVRTVELPGPEGHTTWFNNGFGRQYLKEEIVFTGTREECRSFIDQHRV